MKRVERGDRASLAPLHVVDERPGRNNRQCNKGWVQSPRSAIRSSWCRACAGSSTASLVCLILLARVVGPCGVCWKWLDGKCGLARPPVRSIVECAPQKKTLAVFEADRDRWCSCAESLSPPSEDQCPGRAGDKRGNHMPPRYRYWCVPSPRT